MFFGAHWRPPRGNDSPTGQATLQRPKAARSSFARMVNRSKQRGQRAAPVVVPEGPSAGGGVVSTAVDPGVPLGPGLIATCLVFHGPHVRMVIARTSATTMTASILPLIEAFLS